MSLLFYRLTGDFYFETMEDWAGKVGDQMGNENRKLERMVHMKWKTLILVMTKDCNFRCRYCYQTRQKKQMSRQTAQKAIDFFWPHARKEIGISFLGGEPLLAWPQIRHMVTYIKNRCHQSGNLVNFTLTTNGSLLDAPVLSFMEGHFFTVELSFDGFAQNWGRRKDSFEKTVSLVEEIQRRPELKLTVNSVFTYRTVDKLRDSIHYIMGLGVQHISVSLDLTQRWPSRSIGILAGQLDKLRLDVGNKFIETGHIPVTLYRPLKEKGLWRCSSGFEQFTVSPEGELWGCPGFYENFGDCTGWPEHEEFFFGSLDEFFPNCDRPYKRISANYEQFRMDNFYTQYSRCFLCPLVQECSVCPVARFAPESPLLLVPRYVCEINKILIHTRLALCRETAGPGTALPG